jgi:hypothetical protein
MDIIFIILAIGALNIACFFVGAKVGQTVAKGEKIETPTLNPVKAIEEHRNRKQAEAEQNRLNTIMQNIEKYDGTGRGQDDVPRG